MPTREEFEDMRQMFTIIMEFFVMFAEKFMLPKWSVYPSVFLKDYNDGVGVCLCLSVRSSFRKSGVRAFVHLSMCLS